MNRKNVRRLEEADLYLLGTGIKGLRQITVETLDVLRRCRKVLHLTGEHGGLMRLNPNTVDLDPLYWTGEDRSVVYRRLVKAVLEEVQRGPGVALVGYGHPLLFDSVCAELRGKVRKLGLRCVVLPGVSCLDTLCIDLGIDYGDGLQLFEASQMVESKLRPCVRLHTLLLQLYEFGEYRTSDTVSQFQGRFDRLVRYLLRFYPGDHPSILAYSDDGGERGSVLIRTKIRCIDDKQDVMFPGVSLYIPPCVSRR